MYRLTPTLLSFIFIRTSQTLLLLTVDLYKEWKYPFGMETRTVVELFGTYLSF